MAKLVRLLKGEDCLIDDDNFELVSKYKWHKIKSYGYAMSNGIRMHRLIMDCPKGMEVDHINGNTLDNRKCNLRICSHADNQKNMKVRTDGVSKFKGVSWDKQMYKWRVRVQNQFIGLFDNERHAAMAYDLNAKQLFGEFAQLNF